MRQPLSLHSLSKQPGDAVPLPSGRPRPAPARATGWTAQICLGRPGPRGLRAFTRPVSLLGTNPRAHRSGLQRQPLGTPTHMGGGPESTGTESGRWALGAGGGVGWGRSQGCRVTSAGEGRGDGHTAGRACSVPLSGALGNDRNSASAPWALPPSKLVPFDPEQPPKSPHSCSQRGIAFIAPRTRRRRGAGHGGTPPTAASPTAKAHRVPGTRRGCRGPREGRSGHPGRVLSVSLPFPRRQ